MSRSPMMDEKGKGRPDYTDEDDPDPTGGFSGLREGSARGSQDHPVVVVKRHQTDRRLAGNVAEFRRRCGPPASARAAAGRCRCRS